MSVRNRNVRECYSQLTDYIRKWRAQQDIKAGSQQAFVPLCFAFGEAFQFDSSEEGLMVGGLYYRMQVSHIKLCASRARLVKRGRTAYDWQHYIPLIQRKPGALRNGAPFAEMPLPFKALQRQLMRREGGDRVVAQVLAVVPKAGLEAVVAAVELMLERAGGVVPSAEHVINVLSRLISTATMHASDTLKEVVVPIIITEPPRADTAHYDRLRGAGGMSDGNDCRSRAQPA